MYAALVEYKKENKHCNVPIRRPETKELHRENRQNDFGKRSRYGNDAAAEQINPARRQVAGRTQPDGDR